jgi:hypothetical protein
VDLSQLQLKPYDILGILLPGVLAICEGWIVLRGWEHFLTNFEKVSDRDLVLLIVLALGLGHIVQELAATAVKAVKKGIHAQDEGKAFWKSDESKLVRSALKKDFDGTFPGTHVALDYCLTKLSGRFDKRDMFVATSGLCRSIVVLSALAVIPAGRVAFCAGRSMHQSLGIFALLLALLASVAVLAWRRMDHFDELAETTVFRAYLAIAYGPQTKP